MQSSARHALTFIFTGRENDFLPCEENMIACLLSDFALVKALRLASQVDAVMNGPEIGDIFARLASFDYVQAGIGNGGVVVHWIITLCGQCALRRYDRIGTTNLDDVPPDTSAEWLGF